MRTYRVRTNKKTKSLLPVPGRRRMFLLTYPHGHVVTVPYTLTAS
jgi:hypothetical protein